MAAVNGSNPEVAVNGTDAVNSEITLHTYDWVFKDEYGDNGQSVIHCWGLDRDSKTTLIRYLDFPNFCYIELPTFVRNKPHNWDALESKHLVKIISDILKEDAPLSFKFRKCKKTYYYRGNTTYPMILVEFATMKAMRHCQSILERALKTERWGFIKCSMWEVQISTIRKLLTYKDVEYSGWHKVAVTKVPADEKISKLENEYIGEWRSMERIPNEVCKSWSTKPSILVFDIETYSDNKRAMPEPLYAPCVAYMISAIYQRLGEPQSRKRYGIIIGDCNDVEIPSGSGSDQDPKGSGAPPTSSAGGSTHCEITRVNNEIDLIYEFCRIINETDPDILSGYNIFGYDYPYLDKRLKRRLKTWPNCSRLIKNKSEMTSISWKSGAYGYNTIEMLNMEGRISIDLLPIVRRDYKLDKYTLDFVCKKMLRKGKHDVKATEMFAIFEDMTKAKKMRVQMLSGKTKNPDIEAVYQKAVADTTRVMAYCIQDSELVIELIEKINVWISLIQMSNIVGVSIVEIFTRGQQIRCMSQLYNLASKMGFIIDARDNPTFKFSGGFVFEPVPGLYDNIICLDFASLYPSIMQAYNICFTTLIAPEHMKDVADEDCNTIEFDQEEDLSGNPIEDPEGDDAGGGEDVPDIGIEKGANIDGIEFADDTVNDETESETVEPIAVVKPKKTVTRHYKFKFYKHREGLLPALVRNLVMERRAVRKQLATEKDPLVKMVLDKRQGALKVSANSFFGFLGVRSGGKMSLIEGAMSITAYGRQLIGQVNNYISNQYPGSKIVYNDTDSAMVDLNIKDITKCQAIGEQLADEINGVKKGDLLPGHKDDEERTINNTYAETIPGLFPTPLAMEFEKGMRLLLFKKKKYAYLLINKKGEYVRDKDTKALKIEKKGILTARRDNCQFVRNVFDAILEKAITRTPFVQALSYLIDSLANLIENKINYNDMVIIRALGANYKQENYFMKVFSDDLKEAGKIVNAGDRLDYVVVLDPSEITALQNKQKLPKILLGHKMKLLEQYTDALSGDIDTITNVANAASVANTRYQIDNMYYINNLMKNGINQLFEVGYSRDLAKYKDRITIKKSTRHKIVTIETPINLLSIMIELNKDLHKTKKQIIDYIENLESEDF